MLLRPLKFSFPRYFRLNSKWPSRYYRLNSKWLSNSIVEWHVFAPLQYTLNVLKSSLDAKFQTNMKQTNMKQTNLKQTNLKQTNMKQTNMKQTNMKQTNMKQTNLKQTWLLFKTWDIGLNSSKLHFRFEIPFLNSYR